ncbi:TfuA-like protein [Streptomyces sp. NPDC053728]|uniref:TfuA-like protein n=1 Tax=Streptomyces sp. NPDC053728 TaxID=3155534 RepID=UPI00343DD079
MTSRRFAFVGPTLPPSERPDHGCTYLPPVRHGDLYALDARPGDRILIVDGVYQHFAPIRHKEILAQLARGVHVTGAASLGALRAAELDGFGMRGIGHVYEQARDGRLVADSDVALLHVDDGEEDGTAARGLTLPLVAVRHAAGTLLAAGKLDERAAAEAERAAAALHFTERSPRALLHRAGDAREAVAAVLAEIDVHGDVKKQDALLALAAGDAPEAVSVPAASVWHSSYGREGEFDHRPLTSGSRVTARIALACLQLFAADFPDRHLAYALRLAATGPGPGADAGRVLAAAGFPPAPRPEALLARSTAATVGWTADERLLARTFRLPPGRLVYHDLPPEALADGSTAEVEQWCLRLLPPAGSPPVPTERCHRVLRDLWQARDDHEYRLCVLERGFRDGTEAARLARVFDLELVDRLARTAA